MSEADDRRPLKSRETPWAMRFAGALARAHVAPDMLSLIALAFAAVASAALCLSGLTFGVARALLLVVAAICIQLRMLTGMLGGMVAIEHGKATRYGPLWNEIPDRISDVLILAGAGYGAIHADHDLAPAAGWLCAVLALLSAHVRQLGAGLGLGSDFSGPMAKPQRMLVITLAALFAPTEAFWSSPYSQGKTLLFALALTAVLSIVTLVRRIRRLAVGLREQRRSGRAAS